VDQSPTQNLSIKHVTYSRERDRKSAYLRTREAGREKSALIEELARKRPNVEALVHIPSIIHPGAHEAPGLVPSDVVAEEVLLRAESAHVVYVEKLQIALSSGKAGEEDVATCR
jgi:hypothetical protein